MKTVALIIARKGSKRIPHKNMKEMCGKPLIHWCMINAIKAENVNEIWVATDDPIIEKYATKYSVRVFKTREMNNNCIQETIIQAFLDVSDFTDLVLLQATSPLVTAEDIDGGIEMHQNDGYDCVVSVVNHSYLTYSYGSPEFIADPWPRKTTKHVGNGAFWIISRETFKKTGSRITPHNIGMYEMPPDTLYEVDTDIDWVVVETLLERRLHR